VLTAEARHFADPQFQRWLTEFWACGRDEEWLGEKLLARASRAAAV
jgi:hypothetical protein